MSDTELKPGMLKVSQTAQAAEGGATDELREKKVATLSASCAG